MRNKPDAAERSTADRFVYALGPDFGNDIVRLAAFDPALELIPTGVTDSGIGACVSVSKIKSGTTAHDSSDWDTELYTGSSPFYQTWITVNDNETVLATNYGPSLTDPQEKLLHHITDGIKYATSRPRINDLTTSTSSFSPFRKPEVYFKPHLLLGPAQEYCQGRTWYVAPMLRSSWSFIDVEDTVPVTNHRYTSSAQIIHVNSVSELVTTQAGSFQTVKTTTLDAGSKLERWLDIQS